MPRRSRDEPQGEELERTDDQRPMRGQRDRNPARVVGILAVAGVAIAFIVENSQKVAVHFWIVTGHVHLIWLVVVCVAFGAVGEALLRRVVRLRWRARRQKVR